jgi:hypothetical protein
LPCNRCWSRPGGPGEHRKPAVSGKPKAKRGCVFMGPAYREFRRPSISDLAVGYSCGLNLYRDQAHITCSRGQVGTLPPD